MKRIAIVVNTLDNEQIFNTIELYKRLTSTRLQIPLIVIFSNNIQYDNIIHQYFINTDIDYVILEQKTPFLRKINTIYKKLKYHNINVLLNINIPIIGIINFLFKNKLKYKCIAISKSVNIDNDTYKKYREKILHYKADISYNISLIPSDDINTYPPIISSDLRGDIRVVQHNYLVTLNNDVDTLKFINLIINKRDMSSFFFNVLVNDKSSFEYNSIKKSDFIKIHEYNHITYTTCIKLCNGVISNVNVNTICDAVYIDKPLLVYAENTSELLDAAKGIGAIICDKLSLYTILAFIYTKHKPYKLLFNVWYNRRCLLTELPFIIKKM